MPKRAVCQPVLPVQPIPVHDPAARLHILAHVLASLEDPDQQVLQALMASGFTAELILALRSLPMAEAVQVTAQPCGLSIELDGGLLKQQLRAIDRARTDRRLYEYFVRAGASASLLGRLFGVSQAEARRLRALLVPAARAGGRPRSPPEDVCEQVLQTWREVARVETGERQRLYGVHQRHPELAMSAIELVLTRAGCDGAASAITLPPPAAAQAFPQTAPPPGAVRDASAVDVHLPNA